jgi:hypothetical protein
MKDAVHGSPNRVESQAVVLAAELGKDGTLAAMAISLSSPISGEPVPVHKTMVGNAAAPGCGAPTSHTTPGA